MKKLGILMLGIVTVMVLAACSGDSEKDEVMSVHEDFHNLVDGAEDNVKETQTLIEEYSEGDLTGTEFKDEKTKKLDYMDELRNDLNKIEEPKEEKAVKYYDLSYDLVDKVVDAVENNLDVPENMEDEDEIEEYHERVTNELSELDQIIDEYDEYKKELQEEDKDYVEAFQNQ